MTLDTALRAISLVALLIVLVAAVLVLQTRHSGNLHVTTGQKVIGICAAVVGLVAQSLALLT